MEEDSGDEYVTFRGKPINARGYQNLKYNKLWKYPWLKYDNAYDVYSNAKFRKARKRNLIDPRAYHVRERPFADLYYTKHKENKHNQKVRRSRNDYLNKVAKGILKPFNRRHAARKLTLQQYQQVGTNRAAAKAKLKAKKKAFKKEKYAYAKNRIY